MGYHIDFSVHAEKDIDFHKKSGNKEILKKIHILLNELTEHPFEGLGKPEPLHYNLKGSWSRRINHEHRLIYEVIADAVLIHSAKGHYEK
jgi:toxin YoeB